MGTAFSEPLQGMDLVPIRELIENPVRVEKHIRRELTDTGEITETEVDVPIWVEPIAEGQTPMCGALGLVKTILESWLGSHVESRPPLVVNITDGAASDGDPRVPAFELRDLATDAGAVHLWNCHLSTHSGGEILYPGLNEAFPSEHYADILLEMSSELSKETRALLQENRLRIQMEPGSRGFVYNGDAGDLGGMLVLATTVVLPTTTRVQS